MRLTIFSNERMWDLIRHQRSELHVAGLITDDEYAELAKDHSAVTRLEDYDALRTKLSDLAQAQTNASTPADAERELARIVAEARLDEAEWWVQYGGQACTEGDFNDMWDRREAAKARVAEAQKSEEGES